MKKLVKRNRNEMDRKVAAYATENTTNYGCPNKINFYCPNYGCF